MADSCVITNNGVELHNQFLAGSGLEITSVWGGSGTVDTADLAEQTALVNAVQALSIVNKKAKSSAMTLAATLSNTGLETSFDLSQVGVFARIEDSEDDETLFAIMQLGDVLTVPSQSERSEFYITFYLKFALTNSENITVTIDSSGYLTTDDYESDEMTADDVDTICT